MTPLTRVAPSIMYVPKVNLFYKKARETLFINLSDQRVNSQSMELVRVRLFSGRNGVYRFGMPIGPFRLHVLVGYEVSI